MNILLQKQSLEKEKEKLAKEKELINERFAYRKQAAEQADKDEELSEYRRQLALLEADPTRTKEAKELRRKIQDLEKEQSWAIAEAEVQAENERIDEQTEGYDKYIAYNEEKLNELLSDANNFATEINGLLEGSFEESYQKILDFMAKENEAFMKSLPDAQKQMIQSWEDTWKQANDIVDNNFAQITSILTSKDAYLEFMRQTDREYRSYLEAGDTNAMQMKEYEWAELYDNDVAARLDNAKFNLHDHDINFSSSNGAELKDAMMSIEELALIKQGLEEYGFDYGSLVRAKDFSIGANWKLNDYAGVGFVAPEGTEIVESTSSSNAGGGGSSGTQTPSYAGKTKVSMAEILELGSTPEEVLAQGRGPIDTNKSWYDNGDGTYTNPDTGITIRKKEKPTVNKILDLNNPYHQHYNEPTNTATNRTGNVINSAVTGSANVVVGPVNNNNISGAANAGTGTVNNAAKAFVGAVSNAVKKIFGFSEGGLVDFTGPVMVHGSTAKPEAFLSARDTENMRAMLDAFNSVRVSPGVYPTSDLLSHGSTNVGDINITINQAELKSDADYDEVARRVGQAFTKEISRQGLNLAGYAF